MPGFFWKKSFGSECSGPQDMVKEGLPVEPEKELSVIVWVGEPK